MDLLKHKLLDHCVNPCKRSCFLSIGAVSLLALDCLWHPGEDTAFTLKVQYSVVHELTSQVYRDMRHPYKFSKALGVSYSITFLIDASMGVIGYLMFGKYVLEEVSIYKVIPLT